MNPRIERLRLQSLAAVPSVSIERARLLTEFFRLERTKLLSEPRRRSGALGYILANKRLYFGDDELIVGERGEEPKATPTYPEVTVHELEDLRVLDARTRTAYRVEDQVFETQRDVVLPFWRGRSLRERIFAAMTPEWQAAYQAGVFTEFMEQRSPGHTVLDDKIYRLGFRQLADRCREAIAGLDFINDPGALEKREELSAMAEAAQALIAFAGRYASLAKEKAGLEQDENRRLELEKIADVCSRVPAQAPTDFWEALQYYWFVHLGVITELNPWDSFNPGRLDQHLLPFYEKGLADGSLTREKARELLCAFWIKFNNQPAPPKVGVTAEESGTYTDFALINLGGVTPSGEDGVNELSFLILEVIQEMRLLQPSSMVQLSRKNPESFLLRALEITKTGFGQPSFFNSEALIQEMLRQGKSLADARCGGASGCVETGAFGKEAYILTGYFNLPKVLELALNDGFDHRCGRQLGPRTGPAESFSSFDDLFAAFITQLEYFVDLKIAANNVIERLYATYLPAPFLSLLIDDCLERGVDYHAGGARYNTSYIQGVGIGTMADSLAAIEHHVFREKTLELARLVELLREDFESDPELRLRLRAAAPKYGNDDQAADRHMQAVFRAFFQAVDGKPNTRGGMHRINMLPTTCHVYFGRVTLATADGRPQFQPLSEGISPVQGSDRRGPTAVIRSAAKMDHLLTGGTLLNLKFTPSFFEAPGAMAGLAALIRTYFQLDGHHVQFNVVNAETLKAAVNDPQNHRDLIVRVAGYSDYFVDLGAELQEEIISRTAHADM